MTTFEERWYQEEAVDALFNYYSTERKSVNGIPDRKNALLCMPTGTGKSLVVAKFIKRCFDYVPSTRIMMSTHVKELIKQNAGKLLEHWPLAPLGINSAGLKQRDMMQPIIFGGVQTMARSTNWGHFDFLIIDEAHLLADEGSYQTLITWLLMKNPYLKIIGLTATPYRMGLGLMTNGTIFTDIVYDITNIQGFERLIMDGYLCPLISAPMKTVLDTTNVGVSKGDYVQKELEAAVDKNDVNYSALTEYVEHSQQRRCGLIFASGVNHATHLWEMMNDVFREDCVILHSKRTEAQNDQALLDWKSGKIKHAVNMNMLTTGVDNPMLDVIGDLQPTMSTGKHVQKYGRATRPFPDKGNGLILDFARNTRRLGPINDPVIPRLKGEGPAGDAPVRICPDCGFYCHASKRTCTVCGMEFDFSPDLSRQASTAPVMRSDLPEVEMIRVDRVVYSPHVSKASGKHSIKISYYCGLRTYYDWKSVEGEGYAAKIGRDWFRQIYGEPHDGITNADVLQLVSYLRTPSQIKVWVNNKPQPKVLNQEF